MEERIIDETTELTEDTVKELAPVLEETTNKGFVGLAIAGVLVLGAGAFCLIKKRKAKKLMKQAEKNLQELDDDFDDSFFEDDEPSEKNSEKK